MKPLSLVVASGVLLLSSVSFGGCADAPAPNGPAQVAEREMSRDQAIDEARYDAAASLRLVDVANVQAMRSGAFWVVDLTGQRGEGVHYAITASDGSIRERRVLQ